MKLLIKPNGKKSQYGKLNKFSAIEFPLWHHIMANYYKADKVLDAEASNLSLVQTVNEIINYNPEEVIILATGNHPSAHIQQKEVCKELSDRLTEENINNFVLDKLPVSPIGWGSPKWETVDFNKYVAHNWHSYSNNSQREKYVSLYSSISCKYNCKFCLEENTEIITSKGKNKKIKDIIVGDKIISFDEKTKDLTENTVTGVFNRYVDEIYEIVSEENKVINVTAEHPVYTERGWILVKDLLITDKILLINGKDKIKINKKLYNPMKTRATVEKVLNTRKINGNWKGWKLSKETKEKIANAKRGINNPMKRKEVSQNPGYIKKRSKISKNLWEQKNFRKKQESGNNCFVRSKEKRMGKNSSNYIDGRSLSPKYCINCNNLLKNYTALYCLKCKFLGERNPAYVNGLSKSRYPSEFNDKLKNQIRKRDGYVCQLCGIKEKGRFYNLSVHHIDYDKNNNSKCNLITLCFSCNARVNTKREYWHNYFGNIISFYDNCPHFVKIKSIKKINNKTKVYNFSCDFNNNYFANYILVHNCEIRNFFGSTYQCRTIEDTIEDFNSVGKLGIKNIKLMDELFVANSNRVKLICEEISKLNYDFNIWGYGRIDTANEETLKIMRKAGIKWVAYGIESGSEEIRKSVTKGNFTNDKIKDVVKMTKDSGINVFGNFMFGFWDEKREHLQKTLDFAKELNCEWVNLYSLSAFPNTDLFNFYQEKNIQLPTNYNEYAQMSKYFLPLPTKYLKKEEVLGFRDAAFEEYFSNSNYLTTIQNKFGEKVVKEIEEMLKTKIERNLEIK